MNNSQIEDIKAQFLDEAQDYIAVLESGLLDISVNSNNRENIDNILRSAHSLKGGAAMMEYHELSKFAHGLEDFFKILKLGKVSPNEEVESLLLISIDYLRQLINIYVNKKEVDSHWLTETIDPIFSKIHQHLGDFNSEDEETLLAQNTGIDENEMSVFLFETEVEGSLTHLENLINSHSFTDFSLEMGNFLQELSGLAEMLDLSPLTQLCQSIQTAWQETSSPSEALMKSALQHLRRSQALVLAGQTKLLSGEFTIKEDNSSSVNINDVQDNDSLNLDIDIAMIETIDSQLADFSFDEKDENSEIFNEFNMLDLEDLTPINSGEKDVIITPSLDINTLEQISVSSPETKEENIRVSRHYIQELESLFGELTIEKNGLNLQIKNLRNSLNNLKYKTNNLENNNTKLKEVYDQNSITSTQQLSQKNQDNYNINNQASTTESFDVLEMDNYNDLHLITGEMMESIVQIQEIAVDLDIHLSEAEKRQRELTNTNKLIQQNLIQVTMRPLSDLLQRFPRALRQMEMEYGKQVDLQVKGGNTLLEKKVLENLKDPLLHLFRNAFDHGIETSDARQKLGKPPQGIIQISASYRGNQTIITIKDDGKGINIEKIKAKAEAMGLDKEDLANVSQQELLELIFEPGFTTNTEVTDLSGRGVGMDVVKRSLEEIGGEIQVETQLDVGTTFTLSVPFSLSIVKVLLVESHNILLAFPSNLVAEVELLEKEFIVEENSANFIQWEEEKIPLITLSKWLKFNYTQPILDIDDIPVISQPTLLMIENNNNIVAMEIDRYWGEQEVTIRQVEGKMKMPSGFSGCTILGDGRVVPLVDTVELLQWIDKQITNDFKNSLLSSKLTLNYDNENINTERKNRIMVVDDSINVRRFLALVLEKANYQVEQSKDGQDALEKLQSGLMVDAIVSDIEMPRLDGYGFLANVKNDEHFKNIPMIMLTSRSGEKHRKMAFNLGANAYFSKPFLEEELLNQISLFINNK